MAVKLDNNDEHQLTNDELAWMYKTGIQVNIQKLKKHKRNQKLISGLSYTCFLLMAYESGKTLSEYMHHEDIGKLVYFLATTGLAFANNYNGVKSVKEVLDYKKEIKVLKSILVEYKKLESFERPMTNEVVGLLENSYNQSNQLVKIHNNRRKSK